MERKQSINKKTLGLMGLMMIGAKAGGMDCEKVGKFQESNCNLYDQDTGVCLRCSYRYWMRPNATCVQVSDQCQTWCETNGDCTSCYGGYALYNGQCILATQVVTPPPCNSPVASPVKSIGNLRHDNSCSKNKSCESINSCSKSKGGNSKSA